MTNTTPAPSHSAPDAYLAYDWQICISRLGPIRISAIGRTDSLKRSKDRAAEALRELPTTVPAFAEVIETHLLVTDHRRLTALAHRHGDLITWTEIDPRGDVAPGASAGSMPPGAAAVTPELLSRPVPPGRPWTPGRWTSTPTGPAAPALGRL